MEDVGNNGEKGNEIVSQRTLKIRMPQIILENRTTAILRTEDFSKIKE